MQNKQISLFINSIPLTYGDSLRQGKRKSIRPLSIKRSIHLVLKASSSSLLLRNRAIVEHIITKFSKKFGLRIYGLAVQSDHVHLGLRVPNRILYNRWIRAVTSQLAAKIKGLKWSLRPFTRICNWGRDFARVLEYVHANRREAGLIVMAHERVERWPREFRPV